MTPPHLVDKPSAQLPQGRYPTSAAAIWMVAVVAALTGLMLGAVIPAALSTAPPQDVTPVTAADETGQ